MKVSGRKTTTATPVAAAAPSIGFATRWALFANSLLVLQLTSLCFFLGGRSGGGSSGDYLGSAPDLLHLGSLRNNHANNNNNLHLIHPMNIPQGEAVALPSVRVDEDEFPKGSYYGGKGDKKHLGGFANQGIDFQGVSPAAWKLMVEEHGVQSVLDVGCGRGISTSWFYDHNVSVRCVEGSHDAIEQSVLPPDVTTEHDFSRGPWWPADTVDAAWSVEVLEHVSRHYHQNLFPSFRKAALIYATHSIWGGHHHVEVHATDWWITKFQAFGFVYSQTLTDQLRAAAGKHAGDRTPLGNATYGALHIHKRGMVFINPAVASLPKHHHLFSEHGCGDLDRKTWSIAHRKCGDPNLPGLSPRMKIGVLKETPVAVDYEPIHLTEDMDMAWERRIFGKSMADVNMEKNSTQVESTA